MDILKLQEESDFLRKDIESNLSDENILKLNRLLEVERELTLRES